MILNNCTGTDCKGSPILGPQRIPNCALLRSAFLKSCSSCFEPTLSLLLYMAFDGRSWAQAIAYLAAIVGMGIGLYLKEFLGTYEEYVHRMIGITVMVLGFLQVLALVLRPSPEHRYRCAYLRRPFGFQCHLIEQSVLVIHSQKRAYRRHFSLVGCIFYRFPLLPTLFFVQPLPSYLSQICPL